MKNLFAEDRGRRLTMTSFQNSGGQSLIEIIVALAIGALFIGSAVMTFVVTNVSEFTNNKGRQAALFNKAATETVHTLAEGNWTVFSGLAKGLGNAYYAVPSSTSPGFLFAVAGRETLLETEVISGIISNWKFDEMMGDIIYDHFPEPSPGTLYGATRIGSCKFGGCLSFDGVSSYAEILSLPKLNLTSTITLAGWVNLSLVSGEQVIVAKRGNELAFPFELAVTPAGKLRGRIGDNANETTSFSVLPSGKWIHVAMTFDGLKIRLYSDGSLEGETSYSGGIPVSSAPVSLGRRTTSGSPLFLSGLIDDLRIYARALTDTEIKSIAGSFAFTRYFFIEDVFRDASGDIASLGNVDPFARKITIKTEWQTPSGLNSLYANDYIIRWGNKVFQQTDWSGGAVVSAPASDPGRGYSNSSGISDSAGSIKLEGF